MKYIIPTGIFLLVFSISFGMFQSSFQTDGEMVHVSDASRSDFFSNLPIMKAAQLGQTIPIDYPLFAKQKMRYHYLFYFLCGKLASMGVPLHIALNFLSALGLTILFCSVAWLSFLLCRKFSLFQGYLGAVLALFFCFFHSGQGLFEKVLGGSSFESAWDRFKSIEYFSAFGPYDSGLVSAFWSLNVYTNQRHLAISLGSIVLFFLIVYFSNLKAHRPKTFLGVLSIFGVFFGFLPILHGPSALILASSFPVLFLLDPPIRRSLAYVTVVASVTLLVLIFAGWMPYSANQSVFQWRPGYIVGGQKTFVDVIYYWILNYGIHLMLLPAGFYLAPRKYKKFILSAAPIFIVGHLFAFSPDIATNHKFFNYTLMLMIPLSCLVILKLSSLLKYSALKVAFVVLVCILGSHCGIHDALYLAKDKIGPIFPRARVADVQWIKTHTKLGDSFVNSHYSAHPANLAGRSIYLGWPYFPWGAGYDTKDRSKKIERVFAASSPLQICRFLRENDFSYITFDKDIEVASTSFDPQKFVSFKFVDYYNPRSGFMIISKENMCAAANRKPLLLSTKVGGEDRLYGH